MNPRTPLFLLLGTCLPALAADAPPPAAWKAWLATPREQRPALATLDWARAPLSKTDAAAAQSALWDDHAAFIRATRTEEIKAKRITLGKLTMKWDTLSFGTPPKTGRSLFLSMHGGGGAPPEVNESQWVNQIKLGQAYKPAEGLYLAPRAPTDTWNLWHEGYIDTFYARLIEDLVVLENVNPDRVYIMGYSAGGDGVYQLGPRMADRWAAAAMMAGHPNETSPLGLRNLPFAIQVGALDSGFNRNKVAAEFGGKLDELEKQDPGAYIHFTELHAGKAHWMDLQDRKAIPWMEKQTRQPRPEKIVWHQDDITHTRFYWLAVAPEVAKKDRTITAVKKGQTIILTTTDVPSATVLLDDAMLDLDQPVTIEANGKPVFTGKATRTFATLARTLEERGDPHDVFCAEVPLPGL